MMTFLLRRRMQAAALGAYVVLLWAMAPAWPDDWDGVGFLESVRSFDLDHFQPHPPGYPVYVALLRVAVLVTRAPMGACVLVAVASGAITAVFAYGAARSVAGERAAWRTAVLVAVTPLAFRTCSGIGSEAPALACLAACVWSLSSAPRAPWAAALALGLGGGLGLGIRLSWAPLYLATLVLAPRDSRAKVWGVFAIGVVAWLVPLIALVSAPHLYSVTAAHFAGHAERWGGTIVTEPGYRRLGWLARDLLVDGLGAGADPLGIGVGFLLFVAVAVALRAWRRARWRGWLAVLVVGLPYLVFVALGQNLREQPRHALPLAVLLSAAIGLGAAVSRRGAMVVSALGVLSATRTAFDANARRTIPPPGAQLVELARAQPLSRQLDVFGVSSVRFFELSELGSQAFPAGALGDVQIRLTRLDALPSRVWVTDEIGGLAASPWPLAPVATLCRPSRIDRRAPCLAVYDWKIPYLRK